MAEYRIDVRIVQDRQGADRAKDSIDQVTHSALDLNAALELIAKAYRVLSAAVTLPIGQFNSLLEVAEDLQREFDENYLAAQRLEAVLDQNANATAAYRQELREFLDTLTGVSRATNDQINDGAAVAASYGHQEEELQKLLRAANAVSAFYGIPFVDAIRRVQAATESGNLVIGRYAPLALSALSSSGERTTEVLDTLIERFEKFALATSREGAGNVVQYEKSIKELNAALGGIVARTPEIQAFFEVATETIVDLTTFLEENGDVVSDIFGNIFTASLNVARVALETFVEFAKDAIDELLDLFLQVAGSKLGGLLDLDEGLGDIEGYRNAVRSLTEDQRRLANAERQLAAEREHADALLTDLAAKGFSQGDIAEQADIQAKLLERSEKTVANLARDVEKGATEVDRLRDAVLGISRDGVLAPVAEAIAEFDDVVDKLNKTGVLDLDARMAQLRDRARELRDDLRSAGESRPFGPALPPGFGGDGASATDGTSTKRFSSEIIALQQRYGEILDPQREFRAQQAEINKLLEAGALLPEEYAEALSRLYAEGIQGATTLADGFLEAMAKVHEEAIRNGDVVVQAYDVGIDFLTDGFIALAHDGTDAFRQLADGAIREIERIAIRAAILKLVNLGFGAAFGGGTTTAVPDATGGTVYDGVYARGGPVIAGRSYVVGEEGPEILRIKSPGEVVPLDRAGGQQQQVNVRVIQVRDQDSLQAAIANGSFRNEVMAVIQSERASISGILP